MFDFRKKRFNCNGTTQTNQLYVEYGLECPCDCSFCHNKVMAKNRKNVCLSEVDRAVLKYYSDCKCIVFGGGEPLLNFEKIMALVQTIRQNERKTETTYPYELSADAVRCHIVTNGERELYHKYLYSKVDNTKKDIVGILLGEYDAEKDKHSEVCKRCDVFDKIIISRHHYDDYKNKVLFGDTNELLSTSDYRWMCNGQKEKIMLYCVCQQGGIDSVEEIFGYINWAIKLGYKNILFSDLDLNNTPGTIYATRKIGNNIFRSAIEMLIMWNIKRAPHEVYNSSGYNTTTLRISKGLFLDHDIMNDETVSISFKKYLDVPSVNKRFCNYINEHIVCSDGTVI